MESLPSVRSRITHAFNDGELRDFCFDHFPTVYNEFTTGMAKGQMIQILLDYCIRRQTESALLTALEWERPGLVGVDRDALLAQLEAVNLSPVSAASLARDIPGQTVANQAPNQEVQGVFYGLVYVGMSPPVPHGLSASVSISQEKIAQQQEWLKIWSSQLHNLLNQLAMHGEAWALPEIIGDIRSAWAEIAKIEQFLLGWGVVVTDHLDDES